LLLLTLLALSFKLNNGASPTTAAHCQAPYVYYDTPTPDVCLLCWETNAPNGGTNAAYNYATNTCQAGTAGGTTCSTDGYEQRKVCADLITGTNDFQTAAYVTKACTTAGTTSWNFPTSACIADACTAGGASAGYVCAAKVPQVAADCKAPYVFKAGTGGANTCVSCWTSGLTGFGNTADGYSYKDNACTLGNICTADGYEARKVCTKNPGLMLSAVKEVTKNCDETGKKAFDFTTATCVAEACTGLSAGQVCAKKITAGSEKLGLGILSLASLLVTLLY